MSLQIICGRAGSGKSRCIMDMIKALPDDERAVLLVPDQYSFEAEKNMVTMLGGAGLNGKEVLTLSRMMHRMLAEKREYIKPAGKYMLLYKAIEKVKKENNIFGKSLSKPGFIDVLANLISEMKRYGVDIADLTVKAESMPDGMLKQKLDAILKIYCEYERLMPENLADSENNMQRLSEVIAESDAFENTHVFIDEFSDFMPQHYRIIQQFMRKAKSVTAALCVDTNEDEYSVFYPVMKTFNNLKYLADEYSVEIKEDIIPRDTKRYKNDALAFLEKEWGTDKVYEKGTQNIKCVEAFDPYNEIERVAIEIIGLVRDKGYRFKDIGILCADMDNYYHIIEVIFRQYGISYFTDKKLAITNHPIILPILSIFNIFADGFSYSAMFEYLRTGYARVTDDEIDLLENYVLERGVRGKKMWFSENEWKKNAEGIFDEAIGRGKKDDESENVIDGIRRKVIAPFVEFEKNFDGRKTVRQICGALFEFLTDGINLADTVKERIDTFIENGNMDEAEQYRQIWKIFVDVLDQAVMVMGDEKCGMERFSEIITLALSQYEIAIIPSGADMVNISGLDRSRSAEVKALFVIGACYGSIPQISTKEGVLSDNDRRILLKLGIELAPDTKTKVYDSLFKVYKAFTSATDMLYVSYSTASTDGEAKNPAMIIEDLKKQFKGLTVETFSIDDNAVSDRFVVLPKPAFSHMITAMSDKKKHSPQWQSVYEWYRKNGEYASRLHILEDVKKNRTAHLSKAVADKLYSDKVEYSASRLERFAECPFKYFVQYGLGIKERNVWGVRSLDIGNLMHFVLKRYCECVEERKEGESYADIKRAWRSVTDKDSDEIIKRLMAEAKEKVLSEQENVAGSVGFMLEMLESNLRESAKIILKSITQGEFAPVAYEWDFKNFVLTAKSGKSILMRGQIDRVDLYEADNRVYIRIIDYKSGGKEFSFNELYNNFQMQMLIYAYAAVVMYGEGKLIKRKDNAEVKIAGILYSSLSNEFAEEKPPVNDEEYTRNYKFDGLLLEDRYALNATDRNFKNSADNEDLTQEKATMDNAGFKSEMFPIKVTAKGKLDGTIKKVLKAERIELLNEFMKKRLTDIDSEIKNGNISIYPFKEKGCMYCPYMEICRFDESKHKKRYGRSWGNSGDFWKYFEEEMNGKEEE